MIYYKTAEEIELIRENCIIVSKTLAYVGSLIKPGITGKFLDKKAEEFVRDQDSIPGFLNYKGFPFTLCFSKNNVVVHGFPDETEIVDGDIVSVDCGSLKNGFYGDAAYTFILNGASSEVIELCRATNKSLYLGIEQARAGNRVGDIGYAIQSYVERKLGYGVVRELVGHGLGKSLHESPEVMNYGKRGKGVLLKEGLVIAIEPMVNLGNKRVKTLNDGWSVVTHDGSSSAHYEHSVAIRKGDADILSDHSIIEEQVKNNVNLIDISENN
ncbi:MAG TPA: type I methionyl aminopeptidase [Saprospiraceae bacterium]|nr:type I methionyl aminopeptidase [Saprospiraceae bacterium]